MDFNINKIKIGIVRKHPKAVLPVKKPGNVGIDLYCVADEKFVQNKDVDLVYKFSSHPDMLEVKRVPVKNGFVLEPGERYCFSTGIYPNIPDGWALEYGDRSGLAKNKGITVLGGKIDSSYTGELCVVLLNTSGESVLIEEGDRICQMIVTRDWESEFVEIDESELKTSERGSKGFGSSGN